MGSSDTRTEYSHEKSNWVTHTSHESFNFPSDSRRCGSRNSSPSGSVLGPTAGGYCAVLLFSDFIEEKKKDELHIFVYVFSWEKIINSKKICRKPPNLCRHRQCRPTSSFQAQKSKLSRHPTNFILIPEDRKVTWS